MLNGEISLGAIVGTWTAAIFTAAIALKVDFPEEWAFMKMIVVGIAVLCVCLAVVLTSFWIWDMVNARVFAANQSRTAHVISISKHLKGLTPRQTEIVNQFGPMTVIGIVGPQGVVKFFLKCPTMDVPLEAVQDFMILSHPLPEKRLLSIRDHSRFTNETGWTNAEKILSEITHALSNAGVVEYDRSNRAGRMVDDITWEFLASQFGVENRWLEDR